MNSNKIGQKRVKRRKVARAKVLKRRAKLRATARAERELDKLRKQYQPCVSPIRNVYV